MYILHKLKSSGGAQYITYAVQTINYSHVESWDIHVRNTDCLYIT